MNKFTQWPLGINSTMDEDARAKGLANWSCVSPQSNEWWVRQDGSQLAVFKDSSFYRWPQALRDYDIRHPEEK